MKYRYIFLFSLFLLSMKVSSQCNTETFTGEGTYYGYGGGGNCSFAFPYSNLYSGAMNASQYKGAVLCGSCAQVTGENGTLVISIEDQCPECKPGDIDLDEKAFPLVAEKIKGRVPISWNIVSCPVQGPISFFFKEGSSEFWTAVKIINHRNPISKVEYLLAGEFVDILRSEYNYFIVQGGMGPGPYTFRITDYFGNSITETSVPLIVTTNIAGQNQFPPCGAVAATGKHIQDGILPGIYLSEMQGQYLLTNKYTRAASYQIMNLFGQEISTGTVSGETETALSLPSNEFLLIKFQHGERSMTKKLKTN